MSKFGYVFVVGVDGFGQDVAPAIEEGIYFDFDKAFQRLVELNHNGIQNCDPFYEEGYGEYECPESDKKMAKALKEKNWDLFYTLLEDHILTDENEINKQFIDCDPYFHMYALQKIEIMD